MITISIITVAAIFLFNISSGLLTATPEINNIDNSHKIKQNVSDYHEGMFVNLPPIPDNIISIKNSAAQLNFDHKDLDETYYKQPEFYPTFDAYKEKIKNPPQDRIALWGFGAYPSKKELSMKTGNVAKTATFFHASWLVRTYQGMKLKASYDKQYFDIAINPDTFVLGPAFPVFDYNWTRKIVITIYAKDDIPLGTYTINIETDSPPEKDITAWKELYNNYVNLPPIGISRPYFQVVVKING